MKTKLLFLLFSLFYFLTFSQTSVPDDLFELYLETHDANGDVVSIGDASSLGDGDETNNSVPTSKINTLTNLDVSGQSIMDMTGIEDFIALETLNCSSNNFLPTLNVFNNIALTEIRAFNCDLTSLTLPNNNILEYLSIGNNNLSGLDVSDYPLLEYLSCSNNFGNNIGNLDLSSNPNLITLWCQNAGITDLDISQCTNLDFLVCYDNSLSSLDLTANTALSEIRCYSSSINTLTFANSNYNSLTYLDCSNNPIGSLNVSVFPNLETLYCANNNLTSLDVSNLTSLIDFGLWENNLSSLNLSNNASLEYVEPGSNTNLSNLTLPDNKTTLTQLWAYDMNLSSLNYAEYTQLQFLDIGMNNFTNADISMLPNLLEFYCNENQLTYLNIANAHNDTLDWMWAHNNLLTCIQVDDVAEATGMSQPNWKRDIGAEWNLSCELGINNFNLSNILMYPNPVKNIIGIELNTPANFALYNMHGQEIKKGFLNLGNNMLNISSLSSGLYYLQIKTTTEKVVKKIIKE